MISFYKEDRNKFNKEYLNEAKEKAQFMSCLFTLININENNNKNINIPILFDASCSGLQHLSALTCDVNLAGLVNLLNNIKPQDFYQYCANNIIKKIEDLND